MQKSREIFQETASMANNAEKVECSQLRPNVYVEGRKSLVSLVRTDDREEGVKRALHLIGGIKSAIRDLDGGYVLVKPNCNSYDPFPASTHPDTLRVVLELLMEAGLNGEQIVVGDMSGPAWLPTKVTMEKNGILDVAEDLGVRVSFFEEEEWVWVIPEKAASWPEGFRIAKTAFQASRVISLPCLKTHQFGGIFTLSLKNAVGLINPTDRNLLHKRPGFRIAEINLAYTSDLVILDGLKCFVSGGPAHGKEMPSNVIIAGGDRAAVDAVGVAILKFYEADGIKGIEVKTHEQLRRAAELDIGQIDASQIALKTFNMIHDGKFERIVDFVKHQM